MEFQPALLKDCHIFWSSAAVAAEPAFVAMSETEEGGGFHRPVMSKEGAVLFLSLNNWQGHI